MLLYPNNNFFLDTSDCDHEELLTELPEEAIENGMYD